MYPVVVAQCDHTMPNTPRNISDDLGVAPWTAKVRTNITCALLAQKGGRSLSVSTQIIDIDGMVA